MGIDPRLIFAQMNQESHGDQGAVSKAGARGLMQLMPDTAKDLGVDANDAMQNVAGGVEYMRRMLATFNNNIPLALAAYNWGPGNVQKVHGNFSAMPAETRAYVANILHTYSSMGVGDGR